MKTQREVLPEPEENGQVKHQKVRPMIVKFTSYRRRQQVFSAKKNLKGKHEEFLKILRKLDKKFLTSREMWWNTRMSGVKMVRYLPKDTTTE